MSAETTPSLETNSSPLQTKACSTRSWLLRRICSQNPFYLLSVCFVLHGTAHWFHVDSGLSFSPWPLLGLTAGYTLLLAITGFVIIRFGQVWDDARSILLMILLLFVQLSLIFDETLVGDPIAGRLLLFTCWGFSVVLSESLLIGLRIGLPLLFRLPYHGLLALLFFYPFFLVSAGNRLPTEVVLWRIFLFPTVAAIVLLTLIPAIRRGSVYTRQNGTPWLWPWYPWSLFVFMGVCVCFRAYALSQSFDPVLNESSQSAMNFSTAFGVYFLIPVIFAVGLLLLEIGVAENRNAVVKLAMFVPFLCLVLSFPSMTAYGPYDSFLRQFLSNVGSPVWMTTLGAIAFYGHAMTRGVESSETWLAMTLLVATRVGSQTVDIATLSQLQWWPFVVLGAIQLCLGLVRVDSCRIFIALCSAILAFHFGTGTMEIIPEVTRFAIVPAMALLSILFVGAIFRDDFAWFLRLVGAPLIVVVTIAGCVCIERTSTNLPVWSGPVFVATMTSIALGYAVVVGMPLYRLSSLLCGVSGSLSLVEMAIVYFIRESGWRGASSFVTGIACLVLAAMISSWKAGWLRSVPFLLRRMLVVPQAN